MDKFYKLNGKLTRLSEHGVEDAMLATECATRGGEFSYQPALVYQTQIDGIKAEWPDDLKQLVRAKAAEFAEGRAVTADAVRRAINHVVMEVVVPRRATTRALAWPSSQDGMRRAAETESKIASADLVISAIMGIAPCVADTVGPRATKMGMVIARTSRAPGQLVVRTTEAGAADGFFLCHYIPVLRRSWLVGWITKDELSKSEHGNSTTDPDRFPWGSPSHAVDASGLRPMSDVLKALGLKEVPEGMLLEKPPKADDVPWQTAGDVESFLTTNEQSGKDFYSILGMEAPTSVQPTVPAPTQPAPNPVPSTPRVQDDF